MVVNKTSDGLMAMASLLVASAIVVLAPPPPLLTHPESDFWLLPLGGGEGGRGQKENQGNLIQCNEFDGKHPWDLLSIN